MVTLNASQNRLSGTQWRLGHLSHVQRHPHGSGVEFGVSGAARTAPQWQVAWLPRLQMSCSVGSRMKCEHQPGAPWGQAPPPGIPIPTWQLQSWGTTGFAGIFLPHVLGLSTSAAHEDWKLSERPSGVAQLTSQARLLWTVDTCVQEAEGGGW